MISTLCPDCGEFLIIVSPGSQQERAECPNCPYTSDEEQRQYEWQHRLHSTLTTDPPQYCPECGYHFTVYQAEMHSRCPNGCY